MHKLKLIFVSIMFLFLQGCGDNNSKFNDYLEKGLDSLITEDYAKAEVYFENAVEINNEDRKAQNLLEQTKYMKSAVYYYDNGNEDEALGNLSIVIGVEGGSVGLQSKAKKLEETINQKIITFDDFKGNYAQFESTPYASSIHVHLQITDDEIISGKKSSSYYLESIIEKRIQDDILEIDSSYQEMGSEESEMNTGKYQIKYENDKKVLNVLNTGGVFYEVDEQQLSDEGWNLPLN